MRSFERDEILTVSDALSIAEHETGNYYKLTTGHWSKHPYEVKTGLFLSKGETSQHAFALLSKGSRLVNGVNSDIDKRDFYFICLQDHLILRALKRDVEIQLFPLLVYILTHELVHIVRFCNFYQRFEAVDKARKKEERIVHEETFNILQSLNLARIDYVLAAYKNQRICEIDNCEG